MSTIYYPLSHAQTRIYLAERQYPGTIVFNLGGFLGIIGDVYIDFLKQAIQYVVQKHATLRLQFTVRNGEIVQYIQEFSLPEIVILDFRRHDEPLNTAYQWAQKDFCRPFNVFHQHLYQFALIQIADNHVMFYAKIHHILMDGWSFDLLAREVLSAHDRLCRGRVLHGFDELSYTEYVLTEQQYLASPQSKKARQFWVTRFQNPPGDFLRKDTSDIRGKSIQYRLSEARTAFVTSFSQEMKVSLNTVFVSLVLLYLYKVRGIPDIAVGMPVFNRRTPMVLCENIFRCSAL